MKNIFMGVTSNPRSTLLLQTQQLIKPNSNKTYASLPLPTLFLPFIFSNKIELGLRSHFLRRCLRGSAEECKWLK